MGCATGIVKFVMFFFNFLFVVGGILMVTVGVMAITGLQEEWRHIVNLDSYKTSPILLIAIGCAVFFIAFMGCCGVLRENNCMMMTYAVLMTVILLVQVGIAVAAALYQDDFKDFLHKGLEKSINEYDKRAEVREGWDAVQHGLKCCGHADYKNWSFRPDGVPESCCKQRQPECSKGVLQNEDEARKNIYTEGCVEKMFDKLKLQYVIIAAAVIAGMELIGIVFACCLAARFRRKNYV